jgi:predicted component of type VI protein secretion system
LAEDLQAPLVAGAAAAFFDLRYLVQVTSLPNLLVRLGTPAHQPWQTFQAEPPARWVALTLGRYLQRAPYTDVSGYTETVSESNPDTFLWGRGVWLVAAAAARSIRENGHPLALSGAQGGKFENLPTRPFPRAVNDQVALATEAPIAEMQVLELSRAAFTPVVGVLRATVAVLPTVVTVYRRSPGKLTVEATLAYQMMAARLAQRCGVELSAASGDAGELTKGLRAGLTEELGALASRAGDDAVAVELRPPADGDTLSIADVRVKPGIVLEGKPVEFGFALPVRLA